MCVCMHTNEYIHAYSGPNSAFSVRYVFGFTAENTTYSYEHTGYSMVIDLNLR
jgi:hypothetical protein